MGLPRSLVPKSIVWCSSTARSTLTLPIPTEPGHRRRMRSFVDSKENDQDMSLANYL